MKQPTAVAAASGRLRVMAWAAADGALLGGESALMGELGVTRSTLRQVARLLETEGLLTVRRGANGGYFASRPDIEVVTAAVSAYLRANSIALGDLVTVASLLWSEVVRRAALSDHPEFSARVEALETIVATVQPPIDYAGFVHVEAALSAIIFELAGSRYIELIFGINRSFAAQNPAARSLDDAALFETWRRGRLLEIEAIRDRDEALAVFAAQRSRQFFHRWIGGQSAHGGAGQEPVDPRLR